MYSVPIYLYTGPEFGERNDAVAEAKRAAEKKFGSIDYHQLYTSDVSLNDVLSLLRNGNLFVPARFVVLRGAEAIKKKEDIQLLSEWCEEQKSVKSDDVWLFLVSDETSVASKFKQGWWFNGYTDIYVAIGRLFFTGITSKKPQFCNTVFL